MSTVPSGTPLSNNDSPQQVQKVGTQGVPPSKPSATTGPGGAGVSIPKVGKSGK